MLVEDDSMVRGWVRLALEGSEFRIVGEAPTVAVALELVERRRPDVLLDGVGIELVRELRTRGVPTPAVVMTANMQSGFNERAREAGAQATVLKTGSADDLIVALRVAAEGGSSFDLRHPRRQAGRAALSPRERDSLRLVAGGSTNKEVAAELGVSEETVKTLLGRAFAKLGARKRAESVAEAQRLGLL